ncbi:MAG: glycerol-3-phosphate dehydrogenase [Gammaproteobacteria bacterium]|nr:glycerol-3-phosphate dehydrogenase [Gammaproteobacteria bacterium]MDH4255208.1 glycerol-3-phosphate dehydrogenase [Gammaproteobacteria bacterium]MDH5308774.1 glycerol-3-phosphate dehydrogenase [Gammaproteobacteria bacterium]
MESAGRQFDLVVIGGGINGAGIARDAAERGLSVLLLEARDFGSATSAWSTRLIHGGLRYLEYGELPLVYESLRERTRLLQLAPHLVRPLMITIPIYAGSRRGRLLVRMGMLAYDILSHGKELPGHRMLSRDELIDAEPGLNDEGLVGGARYYDAQVRYAERLVLENIIAAGRAGAEVRNYSPVTGIQCRGPGDLHIRYEEGPGGAECVAAARVVVNAAGPWVDQVLALNDEAHPRVMGGTKGSHIVVGHFDGAPSTALYVEAKSDGRPIFIVPWNGQYLIGTTDIRFDGDPADAAPGDEEIEYLINETNRIFPAARLALRDVHFAYAGVRPLPYQARGPESAITRRHIIKRHRGASRGLVSIIGGKLTTYRSLAEQAVDLVSRMSGQGRTACRTGELPLPGAVGLDAAAEQAKSVPGLSESGAQRLVDIYGGRVAELREIVDAEPELGRTLDPERSVLAAEVALAVRREYALQLTDIVHRRMMVGLSADLGARLTLSIASIAAAELDWGSREAERQLGLLNAHNGVLRRIDRS